jgi:uncharacterized membrane protein
MTCIMTPRNEKQTSTFKKYNQYINTCEQHELPMERTQRGHVTLHSRTNVMTSMLPILATTNVWSVSQHTITREPVENAVNLPIRHPSCCSRLIPMVVISEDTGNNSYNNLKSIPIWKIYISRTFPQALNVSRRTFDSNNLCYWLSNFRVNPPLNFEQVVGIVSHTNFLIAYMYVHGKYWIVE